MIINSLTENLIRIYNIHVPINDISNVVSAFGGYIEEIPDDLCGGIKKQNDRFVIYVPSFYSAERKRFAIAQELGHLFLHMGYMINPELWNKQNNMTYYKSKHPLEEYQANEFAEALLMPKDVYKKVLNQYTVGNKVQTAKIAEFFGVSVSTAYDRGVLLGLLVSWML